MRRAIVVFALILLVASVACAGLNLETKVEAHGWWEQMSVERAIRLGYLDESARYKWELCHSGGGIDTRIGGTKQPVGAGGIRDMRTDLWGGAGGIVVNPYTDANGYGVYYTRYDQYGDSISIYRYAYDPAKAPPLRTIGAITCGARDTTWVQIACSNYDNVAVRGLKAAIVDITDGKGAAKTTWMIDSTTTHSPDSVVVVDKWYLDYAVAADDTCQLEIRRRVRLHADVPYILVRLNVRSMDYNNPQGVAGDSIRFVWTDVMSLGQEGIDVTAAGGDGYFHYNRGLTAIADVGYQNKHGEVRQEHLFDDFPDPVGAFINIGNQLSARDTSMGQVLIREDIADSVWIDQGSGTDQTLGMFVAFNPNGEVPTEIFYGSNPGDSVAHAESWPVLAYDSLFIAQHNDAGAFNYDSTDVLSSGAARGISFRSAVVALDTTDFTVWEYAIGTVRFSDQDTPYWPAIPKIKFTDGTVLAIPYYRKR